MHPGLPGAWQHFCNVITSECLLQQASEDLGLLQAPMGTTLPRVVNKRGQSVEKWMIRRRREGRRDICMDGWLDVERAEGS